MPPFRTILPPLALLLLASCASPPKPDERALEGRRILSEASAPHPAPAPDGRGADRSAAARGRRILVSLGRDLPDPAPISELLAAASDSDFELRRSAALALGERTPGAPRPPAERTICLSALEALVDDADSHVVVETCRAVASYDDPRCAPLLARALDNADFSVRATAAEGLGQRRAAASAPRLARLAAGDASPSVRRAAALALAAVDPAAARSSAEGLLASPDPFVRAAGCEILGMTPDAASLGRLEQLAAADGSILVREAALGQFGGGPDSPAARRAVRRALSDPDPEIVAEACRDAGRFGWRDLTPALEGVFARFPSCQGAGARAAAAEALAALGGPSCKAVLAWLSRDPNPSVRTAAATALAALAHEPPPAPSRGADLGGELLPGGAPLFGDDPTLVLETDRGTLRIRLFPKLAPVTCAHIAALARRGFYDGLTWHRVVPDFVVQGGCPRGDGAGNAGVTLPFEPTALPFARGTLGMPRDSNPDTGGCQLFICVCRAPHLDGRYTAFGRVIEGMEVLDRIDLGSRILRARVEGAR